MSSETERNPHKKLITSPQIRSIRSYVYLNIKPDQLSKGALYRKLMQYGITLSTKDLSETNNNLENSHLKSNLFLVKLFLFTIPIKIKIFCNKIILVLNILSILGFSPT